MLLSPDPRRMPAGPRAAPIAGSIAAHLIFFVWLFAAPHVKNPSAYTQLIRPHETQLVWYNFKAKLPDVSPVARAAEKKPLRAESIEKQSIVSSPADAPRSAQMIFHPAPELKPEPIKPLPNILALSAPPPPQREFVPPAPHPQPAAQPAKQVAELSPAPELQPRVDRSRTFELPKVAKIFLPPAERRPEATAHLRVSDAPSLTPEKAALAASAAKAVDQGSRTLAFRPQQKRSFTASVGALPDAPVLQGATASTANIAVMGLNPVDQLKVPLPEGSRRAQFSAGPKLNPDGATANGRSSGITVPDLTVRGGDKDAARNLIARALSPAYNSPTSAESLRASARDAARRNSVDDDIGRASGTRVSGAPDPRFLGRQVFSVAIQSPNLTSHSGSWLMWYADREELSYRAQISAPQPLHKVDPKYIATAAEEKIEGTVRLAFVISSDGRVFSIETVKGIDERLNESAVEALQKWTFTPAMREGKPVAVDALVEIPFRLAPPEVN